MFTSDGSLTLCVSDLQKIREALAPRVDEIARTLAKKLSAAKIVPDAVLPANVVALGSLVTLKDESSKAVARVQIVEPDQAELDTLAVSVTSPAGIALIGLTKGQTVYWHVSEKRQRKLTLAAIE